MRILVLRGGAIGDFLVTLPALQLLRSRWPEARIELVGNRTAAELGVASGLLDAAHSQHEARWSALYGDGPLPGDLTRWLAGFDLVLNFWPDPDQALGRRFPLHPGQQFLAAPAQPIVAPAARHFCAALQPLGLSTGDFRARLQLPPGGNSGPATALHPGSGSPQKNWPLARWKALGTHLPRPLLIVGGEADAPAVAALAHYGTTMLDRPLVELAAALAGCRLFIGHDSGISHLAAAVGTPCVLLFGPTDPALWAPPGAHVRVLRRGASLDTIGVNDVLATIPRP